MRASGVWPRCDVADDDEFLHASPELHLCEHNHISAVRDERKVRELVQQEVAEGYMEHIPGGRSEVDARFPEGSLAIGKLGLVSRRGKKDRLIGDSKASGASPASRFEERAEVPRVFHVSESLCMFASWEYSKGRRDSGDPRAEDWVLFSMDVKNAHKSIRTAPDDIGFAVFHIMNQWFVYLVNHFGAKWSAYWWSRLGALLMRVFHFILRHCHVGVVYVDDFLFLLLRSAHLPMVAILLALAQVLGVRLSWSKLRLGLSLEYLGWALSVEGEFCKRKRTLAIFNWWLLHARRIGRQELSSVLGLLIWATQIKLPLRALLAPLFTALHRPTGKMQLLHTGQLAELARLLDRSSLRVCRAARDSDVQAGWVLREVGGRLVNKDSLDVMLRQPKLKNGKCWVRFSAWGAVTNLDQACLSSLRILRQFFHQNAFGWANAKETLNGCADAWAGSHVGGVGGWFQCASGQLRWFHVAIARSDIPDEWKWPQTMQAGVGALELLAQLALVVARAKTSGMPCVHRALLRQCSDNLGVVASVSKGLASKPPLCSALVTLSLVCLRVKCDLSISHVASTRNGEADFLSRLNCPSRTADPVLEAAFPAEHRVEVTLEDIFRPWQEYMSGGPKCLT